MDHLTWAEAYDWLSEEALPMLAKSDTLLRRLQKQHIDLDETSTSTASIICQILNGPRSYSGLDLVDVTVWLKNLACTLLFDIHLFSNFKPVWRFRPRVSRFSVGVAHLEDSTHQRSFRPLVNRGGALYSEWRYKKRDDHVYPVATFHQEARQPQRRDHMRMEAETTQACFEAAVPEVLAENITTVVNNSADLSSAELQQKFNRTRTRLIGRDRLFEGVLVRAADLGKANHHGHRDMIGDDISCVLKKNNYNYVGYWKTYVRNHFERIWNENVQRLQALENRVSVDRSKRRRTGRSRRTGI
ncbi:hypothetical protein BG000_002799 [Podila horticola]|nr:hypothetical protein BG000_002799 [Podila horticola]